jgi:uncharacterized protein (DUF2147 family)
MVKLPLLAMAMLIHATADAQTSPVGLWKSVDDRTGQERALVRISENAGVLTGRIEKSLREHESSSVCEKCPDERKGQPLIGLAIIRRAKQDADDKRLWTGGDITDPDSGEVYRLRLKPIDGGRSLEVRGYIGPFYRNQTWLRAE